MTKKAFLVLADGTAFSGYSFGAEADAFGEVVFNTSMTGYQEMLTDPSYSGQIVVPTYPLIGNYGINDDDIESRQIQVKSFVVREGCWKPNHFQSNKTIHEYMRDSNITGIYGIDTRALTRRLRSAGVMMGIVSTDKNPAEALQKLKNLPDYDSTDFVRQVTAENAYQWEIDDDNNLYKVAVLDCGLKYNILRILSRMGCAATVFPCTAKAEEILAMNPDGILLSPGPGDPALLDYIVQEIKKLVGKKPIMGICLGNQLIARAFGAGTFKLKFGHRGGNHPVKSLVDGLVHITAQNHGYSVDPDTLKGGLEVTHISLNDGTVEGLRHRDMPIFSIQYHSEASPGPLDSVYLFEKFVDMMKNEKRG